MIIKKYIATTEKEAVSLAKAELGEDVTIMNIKENNPKGQPCMGMLLPDILHRLVPELDQERMKPILEEVLSEENAYVVALCRSF